MQLSAVNKIEHDGHERGEEKYVAFGPRGRVQPMNPKRTQQRSARKPVAKDRDEVNEGMIEEPDFDGTYVRAPWWHFVFWLRLIHLTKISSATTTDAKHRSKFKETHHQKAFLGAAQ